MTVTEKTILTLLKKGYSQKEIAEHFKKDDSLRISGLSSIEKTIKSLKKQNNVKTLFQLGMLVEKLKI